MHHRSISGTGLRRFTIAEENLHTRAGVRLPGLKPLYYFSQMFGTFAQPNWSGMVSTSTISGSWTRSSPPQRDASSSLRIRRGRRRKTRHSPDLFLLYGLLSSCRPPPCALSQLSVLQSELQKDALE